MKLGDTRADLTNYTTLEAFQAVTPETYSAAKVLHYASKGTRIKTNPASVLSDQIVDVYVCSDALLLDCPSLSKCVQVAYSEIVLHATGSDPVPSIYLQIESLELSDILIEFGREGDTDEMLEVHLNPATTSDRTSHPFSSGSLSLTAAVDDMFTALSTCASLQPSISTEDNGPSIMQMLSDPSHRWITAENAQSFEDAEVGVATNSNGHGQNEEDEQDERERAAKWRRTD